MATVTVELTHWLLIDPASMATCLADMSASNFRGSVSVYPEPKPPDALEDWVAQPLWSLELSDNAYTDRPAVAAFIGDVVVFFGGVLQVMTAADYQQQFGEAP